MTERNSKYRTKREWLPIDELAFGKLQPQAVDVEEIVLGSFMLSEECFLDATLKSEWFYKQQHTVIANAILDLKSKNEPVDIITVTNQLRDNGQLEVAGGAHYITQLTNRIASTANIAFHCAILMEKFKRRDMIRICTEVINQAYDDTTTFSETISELQDSFGGILDYDQNRVKTIRDGCNEVYKRIQFNLSSNGQLSGIDTGIGILNKFSGGWQATDLVVIAGETGNGKTSLVLNSILKAIHDKTPVAFYSLEMPVVQLTSRLVSMETDIPSKKLLYEKIEEKAVRDLIDYGIGQIGDLPLFFDEKSTNSLSSILMSIRRMHLKHNIRIVVIDYLQLIINGKNNEAEIAEIARSLKNLAKELNITVLLISQLSRDRSDPFPVISRMRGSGQIEEAADIIIMLYNANYYNRPFHEPFEEESTEGKIQIVVGKGRNIGTGTFLLSFHKETTKFTNI